MNALITVECESTEELLMHLNSIATRLNENRETVDALIDDNTYGFDDSNCHGSHEVDIYNGDGGYNPESNSDKMVNGFATMLSEVEKAGNKPFDAFTIVISENKAVHLHSAAGVTREYLAAMIDVLEMSLRRMNGIS